MIAFTNDENLLIEQLSIPGGWDTEEAKPLKSKIKPKLLARTSNCCCYCRRSMHGWHGLTIDIEHVLPKGNGKFPQFTFDPRNLSVSCKRCNMGVKKNDTSYYGGAAGEPDPFKSEHYKFIHPNLDAIDDHLEFSSEQHNARIMISYRVVNSSPKGKYAHAYFKWEELELNTFDEAQELSVVSPSESLPLELATELNAVLDSIQRPIPV